MIVISKQYGKYCHIYAIQQIYQSLRCNQIQFHCVMDFEVFQFLTKYIHEKRQFNLLLIIIMEKQEYSTGSENISRASTANQQKLMKLIRNLQLELGYHGIALKKAEKMIQILNKQNFDLKKENKQLVTKCKDLQLKIVQYNNYITKLNQCNSTHHVVGSSPEFKKNLLAQEKQKQNIRKALAKIEILQQKEKNYFAKQRETPQRMSISSKKTQQNNYRSTNHMKEHSVKEGRLFNNKHVSPSPHNEQSVKKHQKSKPSMASCLDLKSKKKALSFVPFEELQIKTQWN